MSCVRVTPPVQMHLVATSSTDSHAWYTDWLAGIATDDATIIMKFWSKAGNLRVAPAVQTATIRTDKPDDTPTTISTLKTTANDYFYPAATCDIDGITAGKAFYRLGVVYNSSSGLGEGDVTIQMAYRQCGALTAPWSGHLIAYSDDPHYISISGWMPALGVEAVEAIRSLSSIVGSLKFVLTYRTAEVTTDLPGDWGAVTIGATISANGESTTGEQSVAVTDKMWIQFGLKYWSDNDAFCEGDVMTLLGIRSSS